MVLSLPRFSSAAKRSHCEKAPPYCAGPRSGLHLFYQHKAHSSYPNLLLYETGSGTFLFLGASEKGPLRAANRQRQGIIMAMVSCLLLFFTEYAILDVTNFKVGGGQIHHEFEKGSSHCHNWEQL